MNKKVTISDVAEIAGVSITTVSRTINGNYPVKAETKEKILRVIEELDFKPNEVAKSMITKKTNTIGVVIPSITNAFFSTLVRGINELSDECGYTIFVCTSDNNEEELVTKLVNRQVDGIIVADSNSSDKKDFYLKIQQNTPLIFVNGYDNDFNYVSCNQEKGTIDAIEYLLNKGHDDILFIRGSENSHSYNLKEDIFKEVISEKNVLVVKNGNKDDAIENTTREVVKLFSKSRKYSAIFACNDLMAIGAINGLKALNISVPKEVSVIGFDDIFLCEIFSPKITTVSQNIYELGKECCESLLKLMSENVKIRKTIECKLKIRESA